MSWKKKCLLCLVVVSAILYFKFGNPTDETKMTIAVFVGAFALVWFVQREVREGVRNIYEVFPGIVNRFRDIENSLGLLFDPDERELLSKPVAYRIDLGLLPHWEQILRKLADQNRQSPDEFLEEIFNDKKLGIEKGQGLFGVHFWFTIFHDELSGLEQVWCRHETTFVDYPKVTGHLFEPWPLLRSAVPPKYANEYLMESLTLTPRGAWFEGKHSQPIASIPYLDIRTLLLDLGRGFGAADHAIKAFPNELSQKLADNHVEYDNDPFRFWNSQTDNDSEAVGKSDDQPPPGGESGWNKEAWFKSTGVKLCNSLVDYHAFHTPCYSVSISLDIFEPWRRTATRCY